MMNKAMSEKLKEMLIYYCILESEPSAKLYKGTIFAPQIHIVPSSSRIGDF